MLNDISERPHPSRSRTWSFYVVFLFIVLPVWLSVPLAWFYLFYSLFWPLPFGVTGVVLFLISCCEVPFSIYHFYLSRKVSKPSPCGPGDPEEIRLAYLRLLKSGLANLPVGGGDIETLVVSRPGSFATESVIQLERHDPRAIDFRHSIRAWFCKVPWSSIKLLEVQKWLYWTIYNADFPALEYLTESHRSALNEALSLLEKRLGCKIEEGSNPNVTPIRLTIDEINILWRPLTFYAIVNLINWCLRIFYAKYWNVQYGSANGIEYLLRMPSHWDPSTSPRPIVFLHGLGLGLMQYHWFISHLRTELPNHPILVPLQPQISQNIFHPRFLKPSNRHHMADRLVGLLKHLGWVRLDMKKAGTMDVDVEEKEALSSLIPEAQQGICLLSHSNGSYMHAWLLKAYPDAVSRSCFVDPVTFCSWEGDICYNFFYRPCMTGIELILRYFVGTELGVANLLQRHFCWTSNSLWFEEIPNARDPQKTLFLLGGKDGIIHSERVKNYLTSHGVCKNVWYDPEGKHGQAIARNNAGLELIIEWLREDEG